MKKIRIPASEKIRKELNELLKGERISCKEENSECLEEILSPGSLLSSIIKKGSEIILQELLEQEVGEFLGRDHYERKNKHHPSKRGYRNGYNPLKIRTGEGKLQVSLPKVRDTEVPYHSKLSEFFRGNTEVLERLAAEMYARGLSTRDIEDSLKEATGDLILSRSAVSKVTEILQEDFEKFRNRDLSEFEVEYLFLDAVYEKFQEICKANSAILCAWAICRDGRKVLLHLALGSKESYADWLEFLRDMSGRGLQIPLTITTDGSKGLIKAVDVMFPRSLRIRCWAHKMRNLSSKVPDIIWPQIKANLYLIRDAENYEQGMKMAQAFISEHKNDYPSLVASFEEDLEALLNHLKMPHNHRRNVRTTNLIERSFVEERRRTKIIPTFLTEKSGLKLMFSVLIRAEARWQKVKFSKIDLVYLDRLRKELGIERKDVELDQNSQSTKNHSPPNDKKRKERRTSIG